MLVEFAFPHLWRWNTVLTGRKILNVEARGKAMLIHFSGGTTLYSHNQLFGSWGVIRNGGRPKPRKAIRLAIHTGEQIAVLYSATSIAVWQSSELGVHPYLARLGLDLLSDTTTPADVRAQVDAPRFAGQRLASLLLDQGFLAGVGNYLRSEILFVCGLHPALRLKDLSVAQRRKLADAAYAMTWQAYRHKGVTNDLARVAKLKDAGVPYREYRHHVFRRSGLPCPQCGTGIERHDFSGRPVFVCPHCQPAPPGYRAIPSIPRPPRRVRTAPSEH